MATVVVIPEGLSSLWNSLDPDVALEVNKTSTAFLTTTNPPFPPTKKQSYDPTSTASPTSPLSRPPSPLTPTHPPPPTKKARHESFIERKTNTDQDVNSNLSALNDNADALLNPPPPIYVIKELGTIDTSVENLTMIFDYINKNYSLPVNDEEDDEGVNINNEPFPRPGKMHLQRSLPSML
jgi:hypothetical protein